MSSDTADEPINALIASSVTLEAAIKSAQQVVADVRRETYAAPARVVQEPQHKTAGIPPDILYRIKANAERQWADDYTMQKYVIEKQVKAYQDLHN